MIETLEETWSLQFSHFAQGGYLIYFAIKRLIDEMSHILLLHFII